GAGAALPAGAPGGEPAGPAPAGPGHAAPGRAAPAPAATAGAGPDARDAAGTASAPAPHAD
ncbi:hypothetical protein, partial [Streptomyces lavendofoliae]|uniref:hypothetical protein n=1 Tax=Streptomyces lavendofoliae TaxID=67314 RepID=UPI00300F4012